jgi:hypothetical protein
MKNSESNQGGIKLFVRRSAPILLIFATMVVANVAKAADHSNIPSDRGTSVESTHSVSAALNASESGLKTPNLDDQDTLVAQLPALFCYTSYGAFPMGVWMPVGYSCSVTLPFYPFATIYGITGF